MAEKLLPLGFVFSVLIMIISAYASSRCELEKLQAYAHSFRITAEAGYSQYWNSGKPELACTGFAVKRTVVHANGILLPIYYSAPAFIYVSKGKGQYYFCVQECGVEAWDSNVREDDVMVLPAGSTYWFKAASDTPLILITFLYVDGGIPGGIDWQHMEFLVGGHQRVGSETWGNILNGFDTGTIAKVLRVEKETAKMLQTVDDKRGPMVAQNYGNMFMNKEDEKGEGSGPAPRSPPINLSPRPSVKPAKCDWGGSLSDNLQNNRIVDSRDGRLEHTRNWHTKYLQYLNLAAIKITLNPKAMTTIFTQPDNHGMMYAVSGSARVQIVGNLGTKVFDEEVPEGMVLLLPRFFAIVIEAGATGFAGVSVGNCDTYTINEVLGWRSMLRSMSEQIIAHALKMSNEDTKKVRYQRDDQRFLFTPN